VDRNETLETKRGALVRLVLLFVGMTNPRTRGRPRRGTEAQIDHALLEQLLVHGEFATTDAGAAHRYLSYRELAERFGVGLGVVHRFARRHNCLERRVGSGALERPPAVIAVPTSGDLANQPTTAPGTYLRLLPSIREIFVELVESVKRGDTRIASAAEIERMMHIAADLDAEAQQRAMLPPGYPTIEEIEEQYERRMREYEATSPGERGEIPIGLDEPSEPEPSRADEHAPGE